MQYLQDLSSGNTLYLQRDSPEALLDELERGFYDRVNTVSIAYRVTAARFQWTPQPPDTLGRGVRSLSRLRQARRFTITLDLGPELVPRPYGGGFMPNAELGRAPAIVQAVAEAIATMPSLEYMAIALGVSDPGGRLTAQLAAAVPGLRAVRFVNPANLAASVRAIPPSVRAFDIAGRRITTANLVAAFAGRRPAALAVELSDAPKRGDGFAALISDLAFLRLETPTLSQRDLDQLAIQLRAAFRLEELHLRINSNHYNMLATQDMLDLATTMAGLRLRVATFKGNPAYNELEPWTEQHVLLLAGMLRSDRIEYADVGAYLPRSSRADPFEGPDAVVRAAHMYAAACNGNTTMPPEMILPMIATASRIPEAFIRAIRQPLAGVIPYLQAMPAANLQGDPE